MKNFKFILISSLFFFFLCGKTSAQISDRVSVPLQSSSHARDAAFSVPSQSNLTDYSVGTEFMSSGEIELKIGGIKALAATGNLELHGDNSLVRIILVDSEGNKHLIFESYSALDAQKRKFSFDKVCEETCAMKATDTARVKIIIEDAKLNLNKLAYLSASSQLDETLSATLKRNQDEYKIKQFNYNFAAKRQTWRAGNTSVSEMAYSEKAMIMANSTGELPNIQGFEYYVGGVFEVRAGAGSDVDEPPPNPTHTFPDQWDWRNRNNQDYTTSVKNQQRLRCGSCWAMAATAVAEETINVYYNNHANIDLAEEDSMTRNPGSCAMGGRPLWTFEYLSTTGIVDEDCMPYLATDNPNDPRFPECDHSQHLWKIDSFRTIHGWEMEERNRDDDRLKYELITGGPITLSVTSWVHVMDLVGYFIQYDAIGKTTVWVLKNSWGRNWGDGGFANLIIPIRQRADIHGTEPPYFTAYPLLNPDVPLRDTNGTPPNSYAKGRFPYAPNCTNNDRDAYCYWGLAPGKPGNCPSSCSSEKKDCDDSNPDLGPFVSDFNFNCQQINGGENI